MNQTCHNFLKKWTRVKLNSSQVRTNLKYRLWQQFSVIVSKKEALGPNDVKLQVYELYLIDMHN